ncbi:MAG TPA: MoaD/ThiS family protein [Allosphingosinicella sp.]|nr:MoaD/ThiS family protein [Allosphingosinicella sp.]
MKILFFGRLADSLGRELDLDLPDEGCTVAELRRRLGGSLLDAAGARACIDRVIVPESARILPCHEVAFVPPLSGG